MLQAMAAVKQALELQEVPEPVVVVRAGRERGEA